MNYDFDVEESSSGTSDFSLDPSLNRRSVFLQTSTLSGQNEEAKLRRKLSELAGNLSDKGLSSDEEPGKKPFSMSKGPAGLKGNMSTTLDSLKDKELSSSSDEMPTEAQKVGMRSGWMF